MPGRVSPDERTAYLDAYEARLRRLDTLEPLFFHLRADYGPDQRLKPDIPARSGFQWNPRAGQNRADAAERLTRGPGETK